MESNKPSPKIFISLLIGIIAFFGVVIAIQEYTLHTGESIYLETVPVDPRDLLRGDYVTLRYAFENDEIVQNYIITNNIPKNTPLYITFDINDKQVGTAIRVSKTPPHKSDIYIKIKTEPQSWWNAGIYTGIGKFFVPEGTGRTIERIRGDMLVKVKIDKYGTAKILDLYYEGKKINPKTFSIK